MLINNLLTQWDIKEKTGKLIYEKFCNLSQKTEKKTKKLADEKSLKLLKIKKGNLK